MFYENNNNIFGYTLNKHKNINKHLTDAGKPENNYKIIREIIDSEMKARVKVNNNTKIPKRKLFKKS